jgi:hypothetical protein
VKSQKLRYYPPRLRLTEWDGYARAHPRILFIVSEDGNGGSSPAFRMEFPSGGRRRAHDMLRWAVKAYRAELAKLLDVGFLMVLPPAVAGKAAEWWKSGLSAFNQVSLFYGVRGMPGPVAVRSHELEFLASQYAARPERAFAGKLKADRGLAPRGGKWRYYPKPKPRRRGL